MAGSAMDTESDLQDIVHHLPPPLLNPNPTPANPPRNPNPLRPSKSAAFKREERRRRRDRKRQERLALELSTWAPLSSYPPLLPSPTSSDTPWPCDPTPEEAGPTNPSEWSWGPPTQQSVGPTSPPPPLQFSAAGVQARAVKMAKEFFSGDEEEGGNVVGFFEEVFARDELLKGFYKEKWGKGEFLCLVCEGIGVKMGKKFAGCAALVQHSETISKTRRIWAHRAFGNAVRRVLGWAEDASKVTELVV